jgi:hypothetical protein
MPKPQPDELLFSLISRAFLLSGYARRSDFMQAACQSEWAFLSARGLAGTPLEEGNRVLLTAAEALFAHSSYPYYRPFLSSAGRLRYEVPERCYRVFDSEIEFISDVGMDGVHWCEKCAAGTSAVLRGAYYLPSARSRHVKACHEHGTASESSGMRLAQDTPQLCFPIQEPKGGWITGELSVQALRWCPACADEHDRDVGIGFYLRGHNLPHVEACHVHGVILQTTGKRISSDGGSEPFVLPDGPRAAAVPASQLQAVFARVSASILQAGGAGRSNAGRVRARLLDALRSEVGNGTVRRCSDRLFRFLLSGEQEFVRALHATGKLGECFTRALLLPERSIGTSEVALMVVLLMRLFPESDIPSIVS